MKKYLYTTAASALLATSATAGGIDRSGQGIGLIFAETGENGSYAQISFGSVNPEANADYTLIGAVGGGDGEASPLGDYTQLALGFKQQITDAISVSLIYDQPFGAEINYDDGFPFFGGFASIDSNSFTVLGRYELGNGFSVHGGVRALQLEGEIFTVFADPTTNPALLEAESDYDFGGVIGLAYERPEIALRVAVTYSSAINVEFEGTESTLGTVGGLPSPDGAVAFSADSTFDLEFPESVNLDVQSGVAADTLVFGTIRWVGWGGFNLTTDAGGLAGIPDEAEYVNFEDDTVTYTAGVGRRLSDEISVALSVTHEAEGDKPSTTALAPTTGLNSVTLSGSYDFGTGLTVSGGVTYGVPGSQIVENSNVEGGEVEFDDNSVVGVGIRVAYAF